MSAKSRSAIAGGLAAVAVVLAPAVVLACPVCFGAADSPATSAMNNAILALLAFTACVLGGFGAFFVHLMRRARRLPRGVGQPAPALARPLEQRGNG